MDVGTYIISNIHFKELNSQVLTISKFKKILNFKILILNELNISENKLLNQGNLFTRFYLPVSKLILLLSN
jgi:hypothetical protein